MQVKKSPKASLENKRTLFSEIGLVLSLFIVLCAFEYKTYDTDVSTLAEETVVALEDEMIPVTLDTPPPPPEAPKAPQISESIEIVDDDIRIEDEIDFSTEDQGLAVEIMDYQEAVEEVVEEEAIPLAIVEEKPTFLGGDENTFGKWVFERLVYPEVAKENGVQGRVILNFVVNAEGRVVDIKVIRGVDPSLDKEAMRVVAMSPKWKPGRQRDKAVKVRYTFPVIFQLR